MIGLEYAIWLNDWCFAVTINMTHHNQMHEHSNPGLREPRIQSHIEVEIEQEFGSNCSAIVNDVSQYGMGVTTNAMLQVFDVITIVKAGYGRFRAEVRWIEGNRLGVLFSEPVGSEFFKLTDG